jgi:tripartite ATP-independent transporter DctM subunit
LVLKGINPVSNEWYGLIALGILFAAIFIGFPISFTLIAIALGVGWFALGEVALHLMTLQFFSVMKETSLASVPFFLFMGYLLEQSGLMERLFLGVQQLLAGVRGSLYLAVLITATIFAAATGIVGSSVTLLGVMAAPSMIRSGYDVRLSAGAITAGGTLGILIPPSVMLIVMGPVVGVPTTDLFAAAVFPGLLLASLYIIYCLGRSYLDPALGPPLPMEMRAESKLAVLKELSIGVIPVIVVILATLGVILAGIATPTDAGAIGAFVVFLLTIVTGTMNMTKLKRAVYATLEVSCMILLLVAASNYFGSVFSRLGTANMIADALVALQLPPTILLWMVLGLIFVLAWPLEWVPIVLIVIPIVLPIVQQTGIDLIWFCTLVAVCLQTAWLSPPVALSAYFLKGVVPSWSLSEIYKGMMQFMGLQLIGLALVFFFPQLALWLPSVLRG